VTDLEAEVSRLTRDLAEARMERDILKKPPRTLRRHSYPIRAHEDAASPVSVASVVPGPGGVPKRLPCLAHPPLLKAHPGERASGSGEPGRTRQTYGSEGLQAELRADGFPVVEYSVRKSWSGLLSTSRTSSRMIRSGCRAETRCFGEISLLSKIAETGWEPT
jgi:hypothetical protein